MSLFLQLVSVSKAVEEVRNIAVRCGDERIPLPDALHRILAMDVVTDVDIPGFTRSVVDGYAVRAAETVGSSEAIPSIFALKGRVAMGVAAGMNLQQGECIYVPTGGVLPAGADAVVMIEHAEQIGDEILVKKSVAFGENILLNNEDFSEGEPVLRGGRRLSAQDIGVLAAAGCTDVPVVRMPKIGILSTGNELVPVSVKPQAGQVRDVNSYVIAAAVREWGGFPAFYGIAKDDREALSTRISKATEESDVVLISGGSSKDERDMVSAIIEERGTVLVHGIAIAPGKPTIIGKCNGKPVIGLPGHPASAFIVLLAIVRHLITAMTGETGNNLRTLQAILDQNISSAKGREDYVRVTVKNGIATPLFGKSGLLNTLVKSAGVIRIPAESEGLETGTLVEVILW
jgi:molybdopterin molybdotransferase